MQKFNNTGVLCITYDPSFPLHGMGITSSNILMVCEGGEDKIFLEKYQNVKY